MASGAPEHRGGATSDPVRASAVLGVWLGSFAASFVVFGLVGIAQIGWHQFWHRLFNPRVDGPAFDLLCATVAGTYGVALTVYFAGVATVAVTAAGRSRRRYEALLDALGSWWLFFPSLFWYVAVNLIVGGAWGFPRFWVGILVLIGIGPLALLGFAKAAIRAATLLSEGVSDDRHGQPIGH